MKRSSVRWSVAFTFVAACSGAAPAVAPTPVVAPAPAPAPADVEAAAAPVAAAPVAAAPTFSIAAPLAAHRGIILVERPGATVTLHPASGPDLELADGEEVAFLDDNAGVGGGDAMATVEARGVRGVVPNARVVTEARLTRAPAGGAAIFSALFSCGDLCHGEVWLLGAAGARTRVTDEAGPSVVVAWQPDGALAAVGSGALWLVRARDAHVEPLLTFTAPALASDGALFARGAEADDGVFALVDGAPPRRVFGAPGRPPAATDEAPASDPTPVTFEADGAVLRATFRRRPRDVTTRAFRDGRPAPAPDPEAAEVEAFLREQMTACNASRVGLHEPGVFAEGSSARQVRRVSPRVHLARITRPASDAVEVLVDLRARRIRSPRGATVALGGGLDFCPHAVWLGPQND